MLSIFEITRNVLTNDSMIAVKVIFVHIIKMFSQPLSIPFSGV